MLDNLEVNNLPGLPGIHSSSEGIQMWDCRPQAKLSNLALQTATPQRLADCQSKAYPQQGLQRVPGNCTSTILASIPSKMVESIMKTRIWVSVASWKQAGMGSLRGNCDSSPNGEKKHTGEGDSVDILGFSESLWQGCASEVIKECELSQGWMKDPLTNRKQKAELKGS